MDYQTQDATVEDHLMTADEVAAFLRHSKGHIYRMKASGNFPPVVTINPQSWRVWFSDLINWLNSKKENMPNEN